MVTEPRQSISIEHDEDDYSLSVETIFYVLRRRLWMVMLVTVVLVGTAVAFSLQQTPQYEASIKILVGQESTIVNTPQDALGMQSIASTVAEAVDSRPVAEAAIQELDLQMTPEYLLANLSAERSEGERGEAPTQFIQVDYTDSDPERAKQVVNTVGSVLSEQISDISPSANSITATVWEQAATPDAPISPNPLRNGLLALVLGGMLGTGLAFLLEYLDDRWRSPEEAEQILGVPNFGIIPTFEVSEGKKKAGN